MQWDLMPLKTYIYYFALFLTLQMNKQPITKALLHPHTMLPFELITKISKKNVSLAK